MHHRYRLFQQHIVRALGAAVAQGIMPPEDALWFVRWGTGRLTRHSRALEADLRRDGLRLQPEVSL
jgi:hypothetical protein